MLKSAGYSLQQPQSCHLALDNNFVSINYNYPVGAWQLCNFVNLPSNSIHTHTHARMHIQVAGGSVQLCSVARGDSVGTHTHTQTHVCVLLTWLLVGNGTWIDHLSTCCRKCNKRLQYLPEANCQKAFAALAAASIEVEIKAPTASIWSTLWDPTANE